MTLDNTKITWIVVRDPIPKMFVCVLNCFAQPFCSLFKSSALFNEIYMGHCMTKPAKWPVWPAKTEISLDIRPVWSEWSLSAWRKLGSLATHWTHNEGSDQTEWMPRLTWVFAGRTSHFVGFVMRRLTWFCLSPVSDNLDLGRRRQCG